MKPLISIISINYLQPEATAAFLRSCQGMSYASVELIVVDNAPQQQAFEQLQADFQEVTFIASPENLGFAGANNLGMKHANGDYFCFLNNDTLVPENFLDELLKGFDHAEKIGVVCPKILFIEPAGTIQFAGYTPINPFTGRNTTLGLGESDHGQHDEVRMSAYAHGAGMMVKREVVEKTGPMPEEFFLYYEELDWSEQISRSGYKILYFPGAVLQHHASLSTGQNSPLKTYYYYRNRILFMRRNTPSYALMIFHLYFYLFLSPFKLMRFLLKGQKNHATAFLKAIIARPYSSIRS